MNDKNRTLVIGALAGAATGLIAAMLLNRRAQETGNQLALSTGDGIKIGMLVVGLLRAVASLGDDNK